MIRSRLAGRSGRITAAAAGPRRRWALATAGLLAGLAAASLPAGAADSEAAADLIGRGAYLAAAAGCVGCHTDEKGGGAPFAGGLALKTPFGTFFTPNITPDLETGIGGWSDADFVAALRQGVRPDGGHYFPAFPYTSYTGMTEADARAIKAYLFSLPPVRKANRPHELIPPFGWRWLVGPWKWLFFDEGPFEPEPTRPEAWNRGAYLVEALTHCGECHTPRNALGALNRDLWLAGTEDGPNGERVPNITPDPETGIGDWSEGDIVTLLQSGMLPDFDNVQGSMQEAIDNGLSKLTEEDLQAIATYLKALPPIEHRIGSE